MSNNSSLSVWVDICIEQFLKYRNAVIEGYSIYSILDRFRLHLLQDLHLKSVELNSVQNLLQISCDLNKFLKCGLLHLLTDRSHY